MASNSGGECYSMIHGMHWSLNDEIKGICGILLSGRKKHIRHCTQSTKGRPQRLGQWFGYGSLLSYLSYANGPQVAQNLSHYPVLTKLSVPNRASCSFVSRFYSALSCLVVYASSVLVPVLLNLRLGRERTRKYLLCRCCVGVDSKERLLPNNWFVHSSFPIASRLEYVSSAFSPSTKDLAVCGILVEMNMWVKKLIQNFCRKGPKLVICRHQVLHAPILETFIRYLRVAKNSH